MKPLHIIFNIDLEVDKSKEKYFFRSQLPVNIQDSFMEVPNHRQFITLIKNLQKDTQCYVWIHIAMSAAVKFKEAGIPYVIESTNFLKDKSIIFWEVTRDYEYSSTKNIIHTTDMPLRLSGHQSYTANELLTLINKTPSASSDRVRIRKRLLDSYRNDINDFNDQFKPYKSFLNSIEISSNNWWQQVFKNLKDDKLYQSLFGHSYWHFNSNVFARFLNLDNDQNVLCDQNIEIKDGINFNGEKSIWEIDASFFNQASDRFEQNGDDYNEKLIISTRLFIVHETVHKHHNLDGNTANEIGNFPRIIEYLDYQADAIAIILEVMFKIHQNGGLTNCTSHFIINTLKDIIKIAVETTFSFNPVENHQIQVRKANRYIIWLIIYNVIQSYETEINLGSEKILQKILQRISRKPLIELSGPSLSSNNNRTFYNLDKIDHLEYFACMNSDNVLIQLGKTENLDYKELYSGFESSDFDKVNAFFQKLVSGYEIVKF